MPSERGDRESKRRRRDSSSSASDIELPHNATPISEDDYFLQMQPFKAWLRADRDKKFEKLSSDDSRRYFRKFVKKYNRGKLDCAFFY